MICRRLRPLALLACLALPSGASVAAETITPRTIATLSVNDPTLDTAPVDLQANVAMAGFGSGRLVSVYMDSGSFTGSNRHKLGYSWSSNNGVSWTDAGGLPDSLRGDSAYPVLAVNTATQRGFLAAETSFATGMLPVFRTTDFGHSWTAPVNGAPGFSGAARKPWLTVDNFSGSGRGNVYLCFNRGTAIAFTRSTNGGTSFGPSRGVQISGGGYGCHVSVSPNHQVNVVYYRGTGRDGQSGPSAIYLRRSTNLGVSFGPEVKITALRTTQALGALTLNATSASSFTLPQMAINPDPLRPYMFVVYNDDPPVVTGSNRADVYLRISRNGGTTWSAPVAVDAGDFDQYHPAIAMAARNSLLITYTSNAQDPNFNLVHHRARRGAITSSGSLSLSPAFQLGPNTNRVTGNDPNFDASFAGAYDQIGVSGGQYAIGWGEARDIAGGSTYPQFDVFSAVVAGTPAVADLSLSVAAPITRVSPNATHDVVLHVAAAGGTARDVVLNVMQGGLATITAASGAACVVSPDTASCNVGTIAAGGSKDIALTLLASSMDGAATFRAVATTSSKDAATSNNRYAEDFDVELPPPVTSSFTASGVPLNIPDNAASTLTVPFVVPVTEEGTIKKVELRFSISHPSVADLDVYLKSPNNFLFEVTTDNGGSGDNYGGAGCSDGTETHIDPDAAAAITSGTAPFSGDFRPEGNFNGFVGYDVPGTWELQIYDDTAGSSGVVNCATLIITRQPP
jgi:hypothetical protein